MGIFVAPCSSREQDGATRVARTEERPAGAGRHEDSVRSSRIGCIVGASLATPAPAYKGVDVSQSALRKRIPCINAARKLSLCFQDLCRFVQDAFGAFPFRNRSPLHDGLGGGVSRHVGEGA